MSRGERIALAALALLALTLLLQITSAHAGAWGDTYDYGDRGDVGTPRALAILDLKRTLSLKGYGKNLDLTTAVFGDAMRNRVKEFQTAQGFSATGAVGPTTARRLFRARVYSAEDAWGVPNHDECRLIALESGYDPAAVGYVDPRDRGLLQINAFYHPDVDDLHAFDSRFSIPWGARWLQSAYVHFKPLTSNPWRAAIVAFNQGYSGAQAWLDAGQPADTKAGQYLTLVLGRDC